MGHFLYRSFQGTLNVHISANDNYPANFRAQKFNQASEGEERDETVLIDRNKTYQFAEKDQLKSCGSSKENLNKWTVTRQKINEYKQKECVCKD